MHTPNLSIIRFILVLAIFTGLSKACLSQVVFTFGPSANFNPNIQLNEQLRDFNKLQYSTEDFKIKVHSFGFSGTIDQEISGFYISWFNFHYERSTNDAVYEDSLHAFDFHYYRVFTSFGTLNITRQGDNGWFLKMEPLSFGRQKMRLIINDYDKSAAYNLETGHKAIWTNTLLPVWTPGVGLGKDMGLIRAYVGARVSFPRTPAGLPGYLGLDKSQYDGRIAYFSLAFHLQLRLQKG